MMKPMSVGSTRVTDEACEASGADISAVARNLGELPEADRQVIALYLNSLPPLGSSAAVKP